MQAKRKGKAAKAERRDKTYGTLEAFSEFMETFTPPGGDFDPRGNWKQCYAIRFFADQLGTVGFLEIERRTISDGVTLTVTAKCAQANGVQEEKASLLCTDDAAGTLRSVQLESISSGPDGNPVVATKAVLRGEVSGAGIEWTALGRKRRAPAPPPLISNWALFDTVQRLAPNENKPLGFTLLDDGDLVKPGQRLVYLGATTAKVAGGESLSLRCWEQTGYGILPTHYWLDDKNRLLFAIAGQKAFLYDPNAGKAAGGGTRGAGRKKS